VRKEKENRREKNTIEGEKNIAKKKERKKEIEIENKGEQWSEKMGE
jgi:hypothetical protein